MHTTDPSVLFFWGVGERFYFLDYRTRYSIDREIKNTAPPLPRLLKNVFLSERNRNARGFGIRVRRRRAGRRVFYPYAFLGVSRFLVCFWNTKRNNNNNNNTNSCQGRRNAPARVGPPTAHATGMTSIGSKSSGASVRDEDAAESSQSCRTRGRRTTTLGVTATAVPGGPGGSTLYTQSVFSD